MGQLSLIQQILGQVSGIPQILWAVPNDIITILQIGRDCGIEIGQMHSVLVTYCLFILVYLSDVFIFLDCFFTECSISLWIKEVRIILFTFFSFILFQTMNFASYALSHLICTLLALNLAIFARQESRGDLFLQFK